MLCFGGAAADITNHYEFVGEFAWGGVLKEPVPVFRVRFWMLFYIK